MAIRGSICRGIAATTLTGRQRHTCRVNSRLWTGRSRHVACYPRCHSRYGWNTGRFKRGTRTSEEHLRHLIEAINIEDYIDSATSASDVRGSKPDPDVIEAALARLGLDAGEVMMIGDTPYDIEAAARVGVRTIALRCGGWDEADLTGAVAVYADPAELLAKFDLSPLTGYADN